jgi:hypothetical protein
VYINIYLKFIKRTGNLHLYNAKIAHEEIFTCFSFQFFIAITAASQSLTVNDLLTLSSTPSKSIASYLGKKVLSWQTVYLIPA